MTLSNRISSSTTILLLLPVVYVLSGCALPSHYRYLGDEVRLQEFREDLATYPLIKKTGLCLPPTRAADVAVYYARLSPKLGVEQTHFFLGLPGSTENPPRSLKKLAEISTFRGPLPDHADALGELKKHAASMGAHAITKVRYMAVVGPMQYGGCELHGWVYVAVAMGRPGEIEPKP